MKNNINICVYAGTVNKGVRCHRCHLMFDAGHIENNKLMIAVRLRDEDYTLSQ